MSMPPSMVQVVVAILLVTSIGMSPMAPTVDVTASEAIDVPETPEWELYSKATRAVLTVLGFLPEQPTGYRPLPPRK